MTYLIDGHNLIPKVPSLSLEEIDDEMQLVEMLQEFCRRRQKTVEVYFDKAPPGTQRVRNFGQVVARFVREGNTADQAIQEHLARLGRTARNWIVVSSDRSIQASARSARAQVVSSESFAIMLLQTMQGSSKEMDQRTDPSLSAEEIDDWMKLFGADKSE